MPAANAAEPSADEKKFAIENNTLRVDFLLPSGVTTAEMPAGDKDAISHRGRAAAAALPRLRELLQDRPIGRGDAMDADTMHSPEEPA